MKQNKLELWCALRWRKVYGDCNRITLDYIARMQARFRLNDYLHNKDRKKD